MMDEESLPELRDADAGQQEDDLEELRLPLPHDHEHPVELFPDKDGREKAHEDDEIQQVIAVEENDGGGSLGAQSEVDVGGQSEDGHRRRGSYSSDSEIISVHHDDMHDESSVDEDDQIVVVSRNRGSFAVRDESALLGMVALPEPSDSEESDVEDDHEEKRADDDDQQVPSAGEGAEDAAPDGDHSAGERPASSGAWAVVSEDLSMRTCWLRFAQTETERQGLTADLPKHHEQHFGEENPQEAGSQAAELQELRRRLSSSLPQQLLAEGGTRPLAEAPEQACSGTSK